MDQVPNCNSDSCLGLTNNILVCGTKIPWHHGQPVSFQHRRCVCIRSGVTLLSINRIVTAGDEKLLQRWKMCMYILFGGVSSSSVTHYGKFPTLRVKLDVDNSIAHLCMSNCLHYTCYSSTIDHSFWVFHWTPYLWPMPSPADYIPCVFAQCSCKAEYLQIKYCSVLVMII